LRGKEVEFSMSDESPPAMNYLYREMVFFGISPTNRSLSSFAAVGHFFTE
jgi:hypothetical protein